MYYKIELCLPQNTADCLPVLNRLEFLHFDFAVGRKL